MACVAPFLPSRMKSWRSDSLFVRVVSGATCARLPSRRPDPPTYSADRCCFEPMSLLFEVSAGGTGRGRKCTSSASSKNCRTSGGRGPPLRSRLRSRREPRTMQSLRSAAEQARRRCSRWTQESGNMVAGHSETRDSQRLATSSAEVRVVPRSDAQTRRRPSGRVLHEHPRGCWRVVAGSRP